MQQTLIAAAIFGQMRIEEEGEREGILVDEWVCGNWTTTYGGGSAGEEGYIW